MIDALYFVVDICFLTLLFRMLLEVIDVLTGFNIIGFLKKIKGKLTQNKEAYKDFVRTTESYGRVVELPFSVVQPLLRDDSPMILVAQSDRLAIRDGDCRNGIYYIKLSKKDYNEYIKFLEQKKANKEQLKKTEDTLAVTQLINKELNRINEEAIKSVQKSTDDIKNITELYIGPEHSKELKEIINEYNTKIEKHFCTDGTIYEIEKSEKFDQELFDDIWYGRKVIIMRGDYEYGTFHACRFDNIGTSYETMYLRQYPIFARYYCNDNCWNVDVATQFTLDRGVNLIDLAIRCPDFTEKFKKRIQAQRWRNSNDRL